jgi:hypothetical protein
MDVAHWLGLLEGSALGDAMRRSLWLYPGVEVVHIAGFALLVGAVLLFDLRLLGVSRTVSVRALARHVLPWAWIALLAIVPSGSALFSAHATEFAANPAFQVKLALIACAGVNAALFHRGVYRSVDAWDQHRATPTGAKVSALVSALIWIGVITCGRLIAYL